LNCDYILSKVSLEVRENLEERCKDFNVLLDDVSITHLTFSPEFARAIEDKQVAEQAMEKAKFLVMKAEQEQLRTIINGQAEAAAAALVSNAIRDHGRGLIEVRRIEAAQEIASSLAKSKAGVTYIPNAQMLLNVQGPGRG